MEAATVRRSSRQPDQGVDDHKALSAGEAKMNSSLIFNHLYWHNFFNRHGLCHKESSQPNVNSGRCVRELSPSLDEFTVEAENERYRTKRKRNYPRIRAVTTVKAAKFPGARGFNSLDGMSDIKRHDRPATFPSEEVSPSSQDPLTRVRSTTIHHVRLQPAQVFDCHNPCLVPTRLRLTNATYVARMESS